MDDKANPIWQDTLLASIERRDAPEVAARDHEANTGAYIRPIRSEGTECKRSVFDVYSEHARKTRWAEFVPAIRNKVMCLQAVDQEEWQHRLNAMLAG